VFLLSFIWRQLHEKEGLLYQSEAELATAMMMLAKDSATYKKMGEAAHQRALSLFTEEKYVQAVEKIYTEELAKFDD